jgi:hippurate hydrolase
MSDTGTGVRGWIEAARSLQSDTLALRRSIHAEPELGLRTPRTVAKVREALAGLPLEWKTGASTSGAVAVLRGARPGRTVLLRGDMDALPMPEDTGLSFRSTVEGAMHACGHDAHVAMLASAARVLCSRRESLAGTVLFAFQPGEEGWHGAKLMLEDRLFEDPRPEAAFALHVMPNAPAGLFTAKSGPMLASADEISIRVRGRGGHASMPHHALDPIPVACEIVTALQAFVTRRIDVFDPVVITIARSRAAPPTTSSPNRRALLAIRAVSETATPRTRDRARAERGPRPHGCGRGRDRARVPRDRCDERAAAVAERAIRAVRRRGADDVSPVMGAGFFYVLQRPGSHGVPRRAPRARRGRALPCHSNRMLLDEAMLPRGVAAHCAIAERFLARGFE